MSAFLGPIHYWLFNKIQVLESRAFAVAAAIKEAGHGADVDRITADYGDRIEGASLPDILGDNSIHQFLSGLIARTQVFEARLVEAAGDDFGKAMEAAALHGAETAKAALGGANTPESFEDIWQVINDYQLEGMPCDPGADVGFGSNGSMRYDHTTCNHINNWRFTGVDAGKMCRLTNVWLKGFVSGLNGKAQFAVAGDTIAGGAQSCHAEIRL